LRWPHDTLGAHAVCGGALVEIWADTQILREGAITQSLDVPGWTRLHCQGDDAPQGQGQSVSPGLYLTNRSGLDALQRSAPSVWSPVSGPLLAGVQAQANGRWAYQARRIRIKSAGEVSAIYEYRWSDDHWSVLPWVDGLPMIDATRGVLADGTTVDRLTPLGVVRHRRARSRLSIDPDTISIRTTDPPDGFAECAIDRLTRLDGRMHTLTREQGKPIMMRCRDGRILKESVSAQGDLGVFQPDYGDVFAMRNAVAEPDGWVFDIVDETPGSDPDFRISFRDSEVSLSAGRFDLDEYRTVAAPFANRLSLVAGHGLWEHPVERLGLHEGIRPADIPDAETVTSATSDKAQTSSAPLLCLQRGGAGISVTYTQSGEPSQVEACADWRGADALFYYRQIADSGATGLAFAVNGPIISRKIAQGRFTDRVATGPPQPVGRDGDLLFPNPLGAARLDGWGQITELYSYDDTLGVATLTGAGPVVLTSDGLHTLDPDSRTHGCGGLSDALQRQMPEGVTVSSVSVRPGQAVHLRGSDANGPIMVSSSCDASGFRLFADPLGVDRRIRHISWMRSLPGATASLVILQQDNGEIAISDGAGRVLSLVADVSGELLGTFAGTQPRGVVILTDQDAYLLDVDAAVMALARTRPVSPTPEIVPSSPSPTPAPPVPAPPPPEQDTPTAPAAPSPSPTPTPPVPAPSPPEPDTPAAPIPEPQPKPEPESEIRIALLPLLADGSAIDMGRASRDQIRAVQNALRQRGFDPGPIDGIVGPRTQAAIRALQNSRSEPETGLITSQQFRDLMSSP